MYVYIFLRIYTSFRGPPLGALLFLDLNFLELQIRHNLSFTLWIFGVSWTRLDFCNLTTAGGIIISL